MILTALLASCVAQGPSALKLIAQTGHTHRIVDLNFSQDGQLIATSGMDHSVRLWNVQSGRELASFSSAGVVDEVSFSPDSKRLALIGRDNYVRVIDVHSQRTIALRAIAPEYDRFISYLPTGEIVVASGRNVSVRDPETLSERSKVACPTTVSALTVSSKGTIALGLENHTVVTIGKRGLMTYPLPKKSFEAGPNTLHFDSTGSALFADYFGLYRIELLNEKITKLSEDVAYSTHTLSDVLISSSGSGELTNHSTGAKLKVGSYSCEVVASPVEELAAVVVDNEFSLVDASTLKEVRHFKSECGQSAGFEPCAPFSILFANQTSGITIWDLNRGVPAQWRRLEEEVYSARATNSGTMVGAHIEPMTGSLIPMNRKGQSNVSGTEGHFSAIGAGHGFLVFGGYQIVVVEASTGAQSSINVDFLPTEGEPEVLAIAMSPLRGTFAASLTDGTSRVITLRGKELTRVQETGFGLAFSPDGGRLSLVNDKNVLRVYSLPSGRLLISKQLLISPDATTESLAYSPNGQTIAVGTKSGLILLLSAPDGRTRKVLTGHRGPVGSLAYSLDSQFLLSSSDDGTGRWWSTSTGQLVATMVITKNQDWYVVSPDGRFDTNNIEGQGLHWIAQDQPLKPLPLEIFMRQYYEPKLLARLIAGDLLPPVAPIDSLNRAQPMVDIVSVDLADGIATVTVRVSASKENHVRSGNAVEVETGAQDLRVFRNGRMVGHTKGKIVARGEEREFTFKFPVLRDGSTKQVISAYSFNDDWVKSATATHAMVVPELPPRKPRAFIVAIGVNLTEDPNWRLRYAANDAFAIASELPSKLMGTGQFDSVTSVTLASHEPLILDGKQIPKRNHATKAHIKAVIAALSGREIDPQLLKDVPIWGSLCKAAPEDLVILTWSGHGYAAPKGVFHLITSDTGRDFNITRPLDLARSLSTDELGEWFADLDVQTALVIDACNSAATVSAEGFKPGPMGSRGFGQLAYDMGMQVLAATRAGDLAIESRSLNHGLLTFALLEALRNANVADKNTDRNLSLREWFAYGQERVPQLNRDINEGRRSVSVRIRKDPRPGIQSPEFFDFNRAKSSPQIAALSK